MKMRPYGALTSAFLITLTTGAAQASTCCPCNCPPKAVHHAAQRPAPARIRNADAEEYAQSFYDYQSSSSVTEVVPQNRERGEDYEDRDDYAYRSEYSDRGAWHVAPDNARIRFRPYTITKARIYGYVVNDNDVYGGDAYGDYQGGEIRGGDFRGGVGDAGDAEIGGYGFATGQPTFYGEAGMNGPTYNNYGESFSAGVNVDNFGRGRPTPHGVFPGGGMNR
jgi:hypothetical protein